MSRYFYIHGTLYTRLSNSFLFLSRVSNLTSRKSRPRSVTLATMPSCVIRINITTIISLSHLLKRKLQTLLMNISQITVIIGKISPVHHKSVVYSILEESCNSSPHKILLSKLFVITTKQKNTRSKISTQLHMFCPKVGGSL